MVKVPIKDADEKICELGLPVLLPHKVIEYLLDQCQLHIPDQTALAFWDHLDARQDEWSLSTKQFRSLLGKPLLTMALYGDEAALKVVNSPQSKIYGLFLSLPLFRPTATRLSRYLLCCIESERIIDAETTLYPILQVLVESFNHATEKGVHGRRFILSELRGDQSWFRLLFRHQSFWRSRNICTRCQACTGPANMDKNYLMYSSANGWQTTYRSTDKFIVEELPEPLCPSAQFAT